jgi:hypothetical protein
MDKKWQRGRYRDEVGGREHSMTLFNGDQLESYLEFCDALADADVIPRLVPLRTERMSVEGMDGTSFTCGLLETNRIEKAERKELTGVCGHFHVHHSKTDPGTQLLEALIDHWEL